MYAGFLNLQAKQQQADQKADGQQQSEDERAGGLVGSRQKA